MIKTDVGTACIGPSVRAAALAATLTALLAGIVHAEGAVRTLQCTIHSVCDAAGQCSDASGAVTFRMEPQQLADGGAGSYVIAYDDVQAEMQADTELGPYYWTSGSERHSLIVSSESQWLWHQLDTEPAPVATLRFLECRLTS